MTANWQVGDRIRNRWEIHRILKGGMGVVYVVYDHEWVDTFAVKTFQDEVFLRNPIAAERFRQEALAWIKLDAHPNVTRARMMEEIEGKPFLFLEFVSGGDLGGWIGSPRLTEEVSEVARLAIQFCDGMIHAAEKGIKAHRDIKPQNCLLTSEGELKVSDFGLANVVFEADSSGGVLPEDSVGLTQTGSAAGTCTHMAPEQFEDAKHVDVRADVYSFGVMLFQMSSGRLPFQGSSWHEFKRLHKSQTPPRLAGSHSVLNNLIERCLSKDPGGRPPNFTVIRTQLGLIYRELTGHQIPFAVSGRQLNAAEWNNKGNALMTLGRDVEALPCFDRSIELDAAFDLAWANKGMCLRKLDRLSEAIGCYDKALALGPDNAITWTNKGVALQKQSKADEAVECYSHALRANPKLAVAWFNKGALLLALNQDDNAIVCLRRALGLDPRDPDAWFQYGFAFGKRNDHEEEIEKYDQALRLNPNHEQALLYKGFAASVLGRCEDAMMCFDGVLRLNPRMAKAWALKGRLHLILNNAQEAIKCLNRAKQLGDPEAAEAIATLL